MSIKINYDKIGLKAGLEIHIQLDTRHKLFCGCPTKLVEEGEEDVFARELRPARSELGEVDVAALLEWKKGRLYEYHAPRESTCLVEADEEPPHEMNREALITALAVAKALHSTIVDEVHVMRKIVIDGSNTTGFQRTSIIALGGYIDDEDGRVGIQTICLEEDAARKMGEGKNRVLYKIDRLGIPLIEIATAPDLHTPEQAQRVAFKIGQLVRLTGKAKRGLGTIRQDLNISIRDGEKIEVKGVQHLYLISKVIEYEALRQINLLKIKDELLKRGISLDQITGEIVDVTHIFKNTKSKIIKRVLNKKGYGVYAIVLPGFKGLLGQEIQPGRRFGTELADYARVWGGVGGLFHTDELPGYGISEEEVQALYNYLKASSEKDAIVFIAGKQDKAKRALEAVIDRVRYSFKGVPPETRAANPDGTTRYMRPRPGAARMYPETDIPPIEITEELLKEAEKLVPEPFDKKLKRYVEEYGLSIELAKAILNNIRLDLFEKLVVKYWGKVSPTLIASTIENTIKALKGEGVKIENISDEHIEGVIELIANKYIAKEAIPEILSYLADNPSKKPFEAAKELGLTTITREELERIIIEVIESNRDIIATKRERAFGTIMGRVMAKVRGRADGKLVALIVKEKIKEFLEK
ncbi:MAG: Glu-tRNA(Gln) amidotransferase subunit GatE [Desulfurococcales archaeon]|nr:Glu-tRNA(Gln) amidotransferase subunit GatE [Desulfurococcales archaeon]